MTVSIDLSPKIPSLVTMNIMAAIAKREPLALLQPPFSSRVVHSSGVITYLDIQFHAKGKLNPFIFTFLGV